MYDLKGKKALVTGSSRGIGAAIALELAKCGADICLHYAGNVKSANEMKEKIDALGVNCEIFQADLSDPAAVTGLIERCGGVDLLILNASVQFKEDWDQITVEEFTTQMNCNVLSSMLLIQQAYPRMKENKFGRIVTIGSVQEAKPHPQMLVYSASKAAQTNMAKSLALQLAPYGITVNNVAPGVIYTDRNKEALADESYAKIVSDSIPLGFYGAPEDIAGTVAMLCAKEGSYITGQNIFIDGGKSL